MDLIRQFHYDNEAFDAEFPGRCRACRVNLTEGYGSKLILHPGKLAAGTKKNGDLEDYFPFQFGWFFGSMLIFGGV